MNVPAEGSTRATVGWRAASRELRQDWGPIALYVLKTCVAATAALWIAFRINLPNPGSAMITVFIVSQPVSGLVLEKSLYRLMGTLAGSLATLVMISLFAQQRVLFMATIALWIGVCTACATRLRNFQSYAFVLAGYTSVLIGFAAVLHPEQALQITLDRVSVVSLGILCAGFASDGLFPQHLSAKLVTLVRGRSETLYRTLEEALLRPPPTAISESRHAELIASVFSFESSRSAAVVEDPETRSRSARLQRLNAQFMAVTSTLLALERKQGRLGKDHPVTATLRPLAKQLCAALMPDGVPPRMALQAEHVMPALRAVRARWPEELAQRRAAIPVSLYDDFDDDAQLLQQLATELIGYTETYAALRRTRETHARPGRPYRPSIDPLLVLFNGLRAAAAMLATCAFWIATAWPDAIGAIINAAVFSALFGTSPDPRKAVYGLLIGFALGFLAALACGLWLLPPVAGFPMLMLCLLPFLVPGLIAQTQPKYAGMAIGYLILFAVCVAPENPMRYDAARLVNTGLAQILGGGAALLSFTILIPDRRLRSPTRLRLRLRAQLAELCQDPLRGLRHRFESATRDLLQQQRQPPAQEAVASVLAALELGHATLNLRRTLGAAGLSAPERHEGHRALTALHLLLQAPGRDARERTLEVLEHCQRQLARPADEGATRRLYLATSRLREVLADEPVAAALTLPRSATHAA